MDSKDFERSILPERKREVTDMMLKVALAWIGANAPPDYVYTTQQLEAWAKANGFTRSVDTQEIAALLRRVAPKIEVPSQLASDVNDMMIALTRYIG